jgi:protein-disulfide isomerase
MRLTTRIDRRQALVAGAAVGGLAILASAFPAFAQRHQGPAEVDVGELMKRDEGFPDLFLGPADAKVTIVEYASMTCGHCKHFHDTVYPEIKKKYIDTGKIRFVFREFPLDNRAVAASMLARCTSTPEKSMALIDILFNKQEEWAFSETGTKAKLFEIAKQVGFTQESFDKCLTDQKLLDQLTTGRTRGADTFGVNATPSFFINGKRLMGPPTIEEFDKVLEPLLSQG